MQNDIQQLGQGFYWQDLHVGQRFRTHRRTITEADLVSFISTTGMLEKIFIDASPQAGGIPGRPVPALMTTSIIEGFLYQTMVQGTGLAVLESNIIVTAPVLVGDTIHAIVEISEIRPTSTGNRAIVDTGISVINQKDDGVLLYTAKRMLAGRTS